MRNKEFKKQPDRDVEGTLETAELSFLSLWERAKCSRYLNLFFPFEY